MNKILITIFNSKQKIKISFLVYILYAVSLDLSLWSVAQVFAYEGYTYLIDLPKTLFSYALVGSLLYLNYRYLPKRISGLFSTGLFCFLVLPAIIYFMRSDAAYWQVTLVALGYTHLLLTCRFLNRFPLKINFAVNRYIFLVVVGFISVTTYALLFRFFGIQSNLDLSSIYEIRNQFTHIKNPFIGYLVIWQGNIINPFLFFLAIQKKRYLISLGIFFLQVYLFGVTGIKIFAFSLFFVFLIARFAENLNIALPIALSVGILASCLLYWYLGNVWPISLFVRRTLFTPGQLTFEYLDFFSQNPQVYLSDSVLRRFLPYPYALPPPLLIGIRYYEGQSANVGYIGNSFMHFGVAGVFAFSTVLSIFMVLFDKIAFKLKENGPFFALLATPIISLSNSGLFTVILTHGILLAFVLAILYPPDPHI